MYMTPVSGSLKVIPRVDRESAGEVKVTLSEGALCRAVSSGFINPGDVWTIKLSSEFSTKYRNSHLHYIFRVNILVQIVPMFFIGLSLIYKNLLLAQVLFSKSLQNVKFCCAEYLAY